MKLTDKTLATALFIGALAAAGFSMAGGVWLWAVAGLLTAAAAIVLVAGRTKILADERGITLQTLIVTAVLVLMAGAAGVVIIAITNSAQDDLENQATDVQGRCAAWEIHDPTLEAAGRGGGNGGLDSSAIGCRRVCYIESVADTDARKILSATGAARIVNKDDFKGSDGSVVGVSGMASAANRWKLRFSRSDITQPGSATDPKSARIEEITGDRAAGTAATALVGANHRVEVSTNQRYCRVWDDSTDQEIASLRSK